MMKKSVYKRIESKEREWDKIILELRLRVIKIWKLVKHEAKKDIKIMMNFMMYYKKPEDKFERIWHAGEWWGILLLIFFAFKGFFSLW